MSSLIAAHPPCPFSSEAALPPKLDINVGAKSHFFQPPAPSAVETLQQSTTSIESENVASNTKRKRSRHQYSLSDSATPSSTANRDWMSPSSCNTPNIASPAPLVNTQYRLAGGLDTPTAALSKSMILSEDALSTNGTPRGGSRSTHRGMSDEDYFTVIPSALSREANGRPRLHPNHMANDGWGRTMYGVIGAAGKVWKFCKSNAFRGFYAGKGRGYAMTPSVHSTNEEPQLWHDMDEKEFTPIKREELISIPGRFPEDFIEDYMTQDHTTPPRAAKKIQRSKGEGDMRENWVMPCPTIESETATIKCIRTETYDKERKANRVASKQTIHDITSGLPWDEMRPSRIIRIHTLTSDDPKTRKPYQRRCPAACGAYEAAKAGGDANLKRFNQQLKAMIRQGKEALRTTVEVAEESDSPVDEGYMEGDFVNERGKW
ncbi:MAG: hypothetical protein Q9199_003172 [Rusavskia elegans]